MPPPPLPEPLLSAALRIAWDIRAASDGSAIHLLSERAPGHDRAQCAEALRQADALNRAAYDAAAAWFASHGKPEMWPDAEVLRTQCPGFAATDYQEAIAKNILWARK